MAHGYYADKIESLKEIFGTDDVRLADDRLLVGARSYPIVDDVIVLFEASQYPASLRGRIKPDAGAAPDAPFAEDIQFTFGEEWKKYSGILDEYEREFNEYFDIVDLATLKDARVCDLGCGTGRWSYFLKDRCRELVLLDFSDAIFVARSNLKDAGNALFFMGDLQRLPFGDGFADFIFSLGVLHHLPTNALDEVRRLKRYADRLLIYLYYALDNRPFYFRLINDLLVGPIRMALSKVRNPALRAAFVWASVFSFYLPPMLVGALMKPLGLSRFVPLYDDHHWNSLKSLRQHAYDRFFTRIEQRFTRAEIRAMEGDFREVIISDNPGYWHFLCVNAERGAALSNPKRGKGRP